MRHLSYYWRAGPNTAMFQLPFYYDGIFLRGPEAYSSQLGEAIPQPGPAPVLDRQISGVLTGWDYNGWPQPGIPFSLFTSQYGTAGKRPRGVFSYLNAGTSLPTQDYYTPGLPLQYQQKGNIPFDNWAKKQISQPPLVKADQFIVFNNFGSTPGVLPNPRLQETFAFYTLVLDMRIKGSFTDLGRIVSIDFCEVNTQQDGAGALSPVSPASIPEELWTPVEVAFGFPLQTEANLFQQFQDGATAGENPTKYRTRGCFFLNDDPRVENTTIGFANQMYGLREVLANSLVYPANSLNNIEETAQPLEGGPGPWGGKLVDQYGYVGDLDYENGIIGLFGAEIIADGGASGSDVYAEPVDPLDPRGGDYGSFQYQGFIGEDSGYFKIQKLLSMVRYSATQRTPQLRIRYYESFGKGGGGAIRTTYTQCFQGTGPHGPITPPDRYDNNLNPLEPEGPIYQVIYPNNNEITLSSNYTPNGFVNISINDSRYYQNPDMSPSLGISGDAAPFPIQPGIASPQYNLRPNIYVLPGQTYDLEYTVNTDMPALANYLTRLGNVNFGGSPANVTVRPAYGWDFAQVFFDYWLFEGAEAMICHKLLKLGIDIHPDSVDWYKQMILNMEGLQPDTYEKYLILMKEWKQRQEKLDKAYHRKRGIRARNR